MSARVHLDGRLIELQCVAGVLGLVAHLCSCIFDLFQIQHKIQEEEETCIKQTAEIVLYVWTMYRK